MTVRINEELSSSTETKLKVEGWITPDAVDFLKDVCTQSLKTGRMLNLDLSGVPFVGRLGVDFLRSLDHASVRISGCSPLVAMLLKEDSHDRNAAPVAAGGSC